MRKSRDEVPGPELWATFRLKIIGVLLASPPEQGELGPALDRLAQNTWDHPRTGKKVRYGRSTLERWYYRALRDRDRPQGPLSRKVRADRGTVRQATPAFVEALKLQHQANPNWSYQLHRDNMAVQVKRHSELGPMLSYATLIRLMKSLGLAKYRRRGPAGSPGAQRAAERLERREVRSYETEYVNSLWHLDYHHGSVRVLLANGKWAHPVLLGIMDDHSRLCCHLQWYLAETAENLVHGLCQAILKRGLPRALMTDNGAAMLANETTQGLERLAIVHETTLPYSPYQNGKQECFWGQVEGRLLAMLRHKRDLTLAQLNEATLAWVEMEYNRSVHSELGRAPAESFLHDKDVSRRAGSMEDLMLAFTARLTRKQRRSDATVTVNGKRFEVPSRYAHLPDLHLRVASWDLSRLHLCDPATGQIIARLFPLDKQKNASGHRRARAQPPSADTAPDLIPAPPDNGDEIAPLLSELIAEYAATGFPPAYIPKDDIPSEKGKDSKR